MVLGLRSTTFLAVLKPIFRGNVNVLVIVVEQVANVGDTPWRRDGARLLLMDQFGLGFLID
jgi:hypothetical protein